MFKWDWQENLNDIDLDTDYGQGYKKGFDTAEHNVIFTIILLLEDKADQLDILRSLKANHQSDILREMANQIRSGEWKK